MLQGAICGGIAALVVHAIQKRQKKQRYGTPNDNDRVWISKVDGTVHKNNNAKDAQIPNLADLIIEVPRKWEIKLTWQSVWRNKKAVLQPCELLFDSNGDIQGQKGDAIGGCYNEQIGKMVLLYKVSSMGSKYIIKTRLIWNGKKNTFEGIAWKFTETGRMRQEGIVKVKRWHY
eukprot:504030_1